MDTHNSAFDRRGFLVGGVTVFGGLCLLDRLARGEGGRSGGVPRTLLIVELSGGNDGLSCVVPHADDDYHRARGRVGIRAEDVLKLDDYRGFHPNLKQLRSLYDSGALAIVEGVGYPDPNHSHFTSQDIWHTARHTGRASGDGWVGRTMAAMFPSDRQVPHAVHVGQSLPYAFRSSSHPVVCFDEPASYRWVENGSSIVEASARREEVAASPAAAIRAVVRNAKQSSDAVRRAAARYVSRVEYNGDAFSQDLRTAAALLQSDAGCRVLSVTQGGYDTHEDQPRRHDALMRDLDRALSTFMADVRGTEGGDNCLVMVFSEFGRRVPDNASMGTDHGTAGPMFLLGTPVKGGVYGKHPSLTNLVDGDLIHTTDFRSVYATVLERWLGLDSEPILGARYGTIPGCLA